MSVEVVDTATDDLAQVRADDALLDALGGRDGDLMGLPGDELCVLLAAWRTETDRPMPELLSTPALLDRLFGGTVKNTRRAIKKWRNTWLKPAATTTVTAPVPGRLIPASKLRRGGTR